MEPVYRLPRWELTAVQTVLSQTVDWSHEFLGIPQAHKLTRGKGVRGCVLDTGADLSHPDLEGQIVGAKDFTGSRHGPNDVHDHGTWCATALFGSDNNTGCIGLLPQGQLLSGKVLGDDGTGSDRSIAKGIEWAATEGAHFISMSLGGPSMSAYVHDAIRSYVAAGGHIFAASGNDGRRRDSFPAAFPEPFSIGAVGKDGRPARFSNWGPTLDCMAPGVDCFAGISGGLWGKMSGTSMACPIAAGVCMLAWAANPGMLVTRELMMAWIEAHAIDIHEPGRDDPTGWGLIDARHIKPADPAPEEPTPTDKGIKIGGFEISFPSPGKACISVTE